MSYEVLYITILDFIHTKKFYIWPPKEIPISVTAYLHVENDFSSHLRDLVIASWSSSSMVEEKPQSPTNVRPRTTTKHSTVLSKEGRANLSDIKARRTPKWFLITTLTPTSFESWKKALSLQGSCVLILLNNAKLYVFYWVLMCLKVVIEDHIENTKFAQEKFKKSAFLACALIATSIPFQSIGTLLGTTSIYRAPLSHFCFLDSWLNTSRSIKLWVWAEISNVKKLITCSFELKLKLRSVWTGI